jgi:hypothetical protein
VTEKNKPQKKSRAGCIALAVLLLAAAIGGGFYLYFDFFRRSSSAAKHVPAGSNIALRIDGVKLATFKPVRQHLWPVLFDTKSEGSVEDSKRIKRIEDETGVAIPADLREIVIASTDAGSWVAIVGGSFDPGRFVPGLQKVLSEQGVSGWTLDGELLVHTLGAAIGQAKDGTLVMGTNRDITRAALPASKDSPALPLLSEGTASFYVNQRAYSGAIKLLPLRLPGLDALDRIEQLDGSFTLTEQPRVLLRAQPKAGVDASKLSTDIEAARTKLSLAALLLPGDYYGGKQALRDAKVTPKDGKVEIVAPWPYQALDRGVRELAEALKPAKTPSR